MFPIMLIHSLTLDLMVLMALLTSCPESSVTLLTISKMLRMPTFPGSLS